MASLHLFINIIYKAGKNTKKSFCRQAMHSLRGYIFIPFPTRSTRLRDKHGLRSHHTHITFTRGFLKKSRNSTAFFC
ncbi:hypothetical protein PRIPAC_88210 [Pristionchus pacificus]|nr:hypothetical protein PRIPAC_88210 [Pristionchus pacificus]